MAGLLVWRGLGSSLLMVTSTTKPLSLLYLSYLNIGGKDPTLLNLSKKVQNIYVGSRRATAQRGGRAAVAKGETKSDFILEPLVLAIAYTALSRTFGLPIWGWLIHPFWSSDIPGWIGLLLSGIAIIGFALTLISFGDSFRVGIDINKPDKLVTTGMFAISRNPIYVCFLLFFIGLFFIHCNIVIAMSMILFALATHRQILREEKFLAGHYDE